MIDLPWRMERIYQTLASGMDTPWEEIYGAIYTEKRDPKVTQQYLGPYITLLNRRLEQHGQKVIPGQLKRTYRLIKVR